MKIRDIKLADVSRGMNWRLTETDKDRWSERPMEEWEVEPAVRLLSSDYAVYSAVFVLENGTVAPLRVLKEVSSIEYGGDYCEYVAGRWRHLGLVPNPTPRSVPNTWRIPPPKTPRSWEKAITRGTPGTSRFTW